MHTEPRCSDGDVRLVEGTSPVTGIVQLCHNQDWGTVCANGWDDTDVIVVCKQLGFSARGGWHGCIWWALYALYGTVKWC